MFDVPHSSAHTYTLTDLGFAQSDWEAPRRHRHSLFLDLIYTNPMADDATAAQEEQRRQAEEQCRQQEEARLEAERRRAQALPTPDAGTEGTHPIPSLPPSEHRFHFQVH